MILIFEILFLCFIFVLLKLIIKCWECNFICCLDFFVEIYKIWYLLDNWLVICNKRVDLLILGFLLINIKELGIILLLSIWFNFLNLEGILDNVWLEIWDSKKDVFGWLEELFFLDVWELILILVIFSFCKVVIVVCFIFFFREF